MPRHLSPKKTQMVLDLRQRAGTPSGSEVTEVTPVAEPKKSGGRRVNEASWYCMDWTQGGSKSNQLFQDDVSKSELQASKKPAEVSFNVALLALLKMRIDTKFL